MSIAMPVDKCACHTVALLFQQWVDKTGLFQSLACICRLFGSHRKASSIGTKGKQLVSVFCWNNGATVQRAHLSTGVVMPVRDNCVVYIHCMQSLYTTIGASSP